VIAIDRYLVVARPLKPRGSRRLRLAFIWVVAGALSSVQLAVGRSNVVQVNTHIELEEASNHKSAKTHTENVFCNS